MTSALGLLAGIAFIFAVLSLVREPWQRLLSVSVLLLAIIMLVQLWAH